MNRMLNNYFSTLLIPCFLFIFSIVEAQENIADQDFNQEWLFSKDTISTGADINYDDSEWRQLNLPHDWAIEGPFSDEHNARNGGLPIDGEAWYRKHFNIPEAYSNRQIAVEFDGAMDNAKVYINGVLAGQSHYGYLGFEVDLTPHINWGGENIIAVKLSPEVLSERWYPGAGLYRNVRLKINNDLHIPQWGTYITTPDITADRAIVHVQTDIKSANRKARKFKLTSIITDHTGNEVVRSDRHLTTGLGSNGFKRVHQDIELPQPMLWSIKHPNLYTLISQVIVNEQVVDEYTSTFGVRTISFSIEHGFLLNGKNVRFNGVCLHHDQGPLGAAVNYRAKERQLQIMKDMGVNAIRTSHNPPSPEQLDICDKLGLVVIVEAFDEWKNPKVPNGYSKYFDEWHDRDIRDMIKRDRNHPSVIMWSIGNEIKEQGEKEGWKLAKRLNDICHNEDPTRPTTIGFNYYPASFVNKLAYQVDIVGMNYKPYEYAEIRANNPDLIFYGSETSSQTSSRGIYHLPIDFKEQKATRQVSSYDVTVGPPWAYAPDVEFDVQAANPSSLGEFMWTGTDYLGEPTPYGGIDSISINPNGLQPQWFIYFLIGIGKETKERLFQL